MKKLVLLFGLMILSSQFPLGPSGLLPVNFVSSLEYGRQWTGMFLRAFGPAEASPAADPAPAAVSGKACPLTQLVDLDVSAPPVAPVALTDDMKIDISVPEGPANIPPADVELQHLRHLQFTPEVAKEMEKAMKELGVSMQNLEGLQCSKEARQQMRLRILKTARHLKEVSLCITSLKPA